MEAIDVDLLSKEGKFKYELEVASQYGSFINWSMSNKSHFYAFHQSRRKFLKGATGIGLLSASALSAKAESISKNVKKNGLAKNCIFLVVDGMGRGTLSIANDYSIKHFGRELNWVQLLKNKDVVTSLQNTASES